MLAILTTWANHPWLTRVYDYKPAPGQFINTTPEYHAGEPFDSVMARCRQRLCGRVDTTVEEFGGQTITYVDTVWSSGLVSLGGFGGYVIVGFDHPVVNMHTYDFNIYGNAFVSNQQTGGGSCEPGIVVVGVDRDGDGVPGPGDDWYELAGSEYNNPSTQHGYTITYYQPDEDKERTPDHNYSYLNDTTYVRWTSNDVNPDSTSGYMSRNTFHAQPYWPQWLTDSATLTFTGTKLAVDAVDLSGRGTNWFQPFLAWGYVDNLPDNPAHRCDSVTGKYNPGFKIDWAVDAQGRHVDLPWVDFIMVYNAKNQYCGWLGETSTEVGEGIDFHPEAVLPALPGDVNGDGRVTIADANTVIGIILNGDDSTDADTLARADVNGDGRVTIADANAVISSILNQ
mgnify:CR=1 FL=1